MSEYFRVFISSIENYYLFDNEIKGISSSQSYQMLAVSSSVSATALAWAGANQMRSSEM